MNFKEFVNKMSEKKATISMEQFADMTAEVLTEEPFKDVVYDNPKLFMILTVFGARLNHKIFGEMEVTESDPEEKPEEQEEQKED